MPNHPTKPTPWHACTTMRCTQPSDVIGRPATFGVKHNASAEGVRNTAGCRVVTTW